MRHQGPQVLHQMPRPEVDSSGGENKNPFLVGPFSLFVRQTLGYDHRQKRVSLEKKNMNLKIFLK